MHNYDERKPFSSTCNEIDQSDKDVSPNNIYEVSLNKTASEVQTFSFALGEEWVDRVYSYCAQNADSCCDNIDGENPLGNPDLRLAEITLSSGLHNICSPSPHADSSGYKWMVFIWHLGILNVCIIVVLFVSRKISILPLIQVCHSFFFLLYFK